MPSQWGTVADFHSDSAQRIEMKRRDTDLLECKAGGLCTDSVQGFTHSNSPTLVHNSGLVYRKPVGSRTICHDRSFVLSNEEFTSSYRLGCGRRIAPYKDRDHKPYHYYDKN